MTDLDTRIKTQKQREHEAMLAAAPQEFWNQISKTWMFFRDLHGMETPTTLAVMCGCWFHEHGVGVEELNRAMKLVTSPSYAKRIHFGHDVRSAIAEILVPPETLVERGLRLAAVVTANEAEIRAARGQ